MTDWATERRFERSQVLTHAGTTSGLTVVIEGRRGPFGALGFHSYAPREFKPGDIDFVQALANVLGDVVERQLTDDDIRHRALHDPLTGLPNRLLFLDRLGQATERQRRRRDTLTAVLALDLDRFKLVNDSLGHRAGDELLAAAAPRLRQAVRSSDTVARFGGDEFGILLEDIAGEQDAIDMAERIAGVFTRPFVLDGNEHFVTTSIGIALAEGGERAEDLLRDADAAMHRAKERGRARYELFDEALRGRALSRLRVENDLRRALERDELVLHYQPLVSLRDRSMVSVEALVRWEHPERGRISPVDFIPVAEENGLIEPIGRWVLEHACRQAAEWCRARPDAAPLTMSVNLSAAQVANRGLAETVATALRVSGLDPACLALELTESMLVCRQRGALADADGAQGAGSATGPRRFRDRLLVAVIPDPPAARRAQGRPLLRRRPGHRVARHRRHRGDRRHVTGAVAAGGRRGRRDRASGRGTDPAGLRPCPGLSLLPPGPGRRDHADARRRARMAGRPCRCPCVMSGAPDRPWDGGVRSVRGH